MGLFGKLFGREFDDPRPMSNHHLVSAIAGQADWLEKMIRAPVESQRSSSILELASKRRNYIARLCLEVVSRGGSDDGLPEYPGATKSLNVFSETAQYARDLKNSGLNKESAVVRAVKQKLFSINNFIYSANWEKDGNNCVWLPVTNDQPITADSESTLPEEITRDSISLNEFVELDQTDTDNTSSNERIVSPEFFCVSAFSIAINNGDKIIQDDDGYYDLSWPAIFRIELTALLCAVQLHYVVNKFSLSKTHRSRIDEGLKIAIRSQSGLYFEYSFTKYDEPVEDYLTSVTRYLESIAIDMPIEENIDIDQLIWRTAVTKKLLFDSVELYGFEDQRSLTSPQIIKIEDNLDSVVNDVLEFSHRLDSISQVL